MRNSLSFEPWVDFEKLCSSVGSKNSDQVACLSVNGGDEGSATVRCLGFVFNEVDGSIIAENVAAADVVSGSTDAVYLHWAAYVVNHQGSDTRLLRCTVGKTFLVILLNDERTSMATSVESARFS